MKKILPFLLIGVVLILVAVIFLVIRKDSENQEKVDEVVEEEENYVEVPLPQRPYITLSPRSDGHELKLSVSNFGSIPSLEYKLEYLAGDMERGVGPSKITLKGEKSLTRDLLLGSCSKNVCKYDENVIGGKITIILRGDKPQKYTLSFVLKKGSEANNQLVSPDDNAVLSGKLSPAAFYLVMSTAGLPGPMTLGDVIGQPIGFFSSSQTAFKGNLEFRGIPVSQKVKIYGWNLGEGKWREYNKVSSEKTNFSVEVDRLTTYISTGTE